VRPTLLIATTNAGKLREFTELLGELPVELRSLADLPNAPSVPEDASTYAANAVRKARTLARWSGHLTLADDSGLEVDALRGAPGVRSARYAGPGQDSRANVDKLLRVLRGVPAVERTARFRCVIAVVSPHGARLTAEATCEGRITGARRGSAGFGYDPVFLYRPAGLTFAQMSPAAKYAVSHRARACAELRPRLLRFLVIKLKAQSRKPKARRQKANTSRRNTK
jgi:XTP/dITP diphosphohydrolase